MHFGHSLGPRLVQNLHHVCTVCREPLRHINKDATLFIGEKEFRVSAEQWLKRTLRLTERWDMDSLVTCPCCLEEGHDPKDRNYRRRARRFLKRYSDIEAGKAPSSSKEP